MSVYPSRSNIRDALRRNLPLLLIVLAGVALRLWLISFTPLDPRYSNADDGDYYQRALRLAVTGRYLDDGWLIRPPLHVWFFTLWLRGALLLGRPQDGVLFVQLAQTALGALAALLAYGVARRMFGSARPGLIFAAFLSLWFPWVEATTVLFSELIYTCLFLLHLWLLLRFDASGRWRELFLSGLALGCAALTRSPALYSLAFVAIWLAVRAWSHSDRDAQPDGAQRLKLLIGQIAIVSLGCLLVVLPWTARNYVEYRHLIPVDTLGQINLWLDLDRVADRVKNIETLRGMPQADRAPYAMARTREILAADPLRPLANVWPTFQHIWKAQYIEDFFVKQSFFTRPLRETAWLGLCGDLLWLALSVGGVWRLAGQAREGWHNRIFVLLWLGYSLFTVLLFHVEPRYLLPIWTLLALYGSAVFFRTSTDSADLSLTSTDNTDSADTPVTRSSPHPATPSPRHLCIGSSRSPPSRSSWRCLSATATTRRSSPAGWRASGPWCRATPPTAPGTMCEPSLATAPPSPRSPAL